MKKTFIIGLAGHPVQISSNSQKIYDHLYDCYKKFIINSNTTTTNLVRIHIKALKKRTRPSPITDLKTNSGKVLIPNNDHLDYGELHFNIKIIIAQLLIKSNLLLLHASGFIKDGKMCIMSAPSGTGKSTTCRFAKKNGYTIVCDDSVLLEVNSNGSFAHTTPYQETHKKKSAPKKYAIYGIYFLFQDTADVCTKQSKTKSINSILSNTYIYQNLFKDKYIKNYFEVATKIAENTDTYTLHFTKSENFLRKI